MGVLGTSPADALSDGAKDGTKPSETLAENLEAEVDRNVPDYYEPLTVIPDISSKLQWVEDGEGQVINQHEEFLHLVPKGHFVAPESRLTKKFDANILQMQETARHSIMTAPPGGNGSPRSTLYSREGVSSEDSQMPMLAPQSKSSALRHQFSEEGFDGSEESIMIQRVERKDPNRF